MFGGGESSSRYQCPTSSQNPDLPALPTRSVSPATAACRYSDCGGKSIVLGACIDLGGLSGRGTGDDSRKLAELSAKGEEKHLRSVDSGCAGVAQWAEPINLWLRRTRTFWLVSSSSRSRPPINSHSNDSLHDPLSFPLHDQPMSPSTSTTLIFLLSLSLHFCDTSAQVPSTPRYARNTLNKPSLFTLLLDGAKRLLSSKRPSGFMVEKPTPSTNFPTPLLQTPTIFSDSTSASPSTSQTPHGIFKPAVATPLVVKAHSWRSIHSRPTMLPTYSCSAANQTRTLISSFLTDRTRPGC